MITGLKEAIRDVPDFPKKGIIFKDITTLLKDADKFRLAVDSIAGEYKDKKIETIVSVEARGFIFGAAVAYKLGAGLVPVRKKGNCPITPTAYPMSLNTARTHWRSTAMLSKRAPGFS